MRADVEVTCFAYEGVDAVREALCIAQQVRALASRDYAAISSAHKRGSSVPRRVRVGNVGCAHTWVAREAPGRGGGATFHIR